MIAYKGIQAADVFDRDNLVEQVECLFGAQTQQAAKTLAILHKFFIDFSAARFQLFLQISDAAAYRKMLLNIERGGRDNMELTQFALLPPEDLGQCDILSLTCVDKERQQDRVGIFL